MGARGAYADLRANLVTTIPDSVPRSCPSLSAVAATPDREPQADTTSGPTPMLGGSPAQGEMQLSMPTHGAGLALLASGTEHRPSAGCRAIIWWPLGVVLVTQAALSLRLIWSNTAFQDEGLYLRAGHLEWARWLHGTPIPDFPSYFSGAPVLYPPIAALADSLGGLAAARILSLIFMLAVTGLLWATTLRLYGQRAALLAAGLFATLAGTQFLGALATFDALALVLLAIAVWLGVCAADSHGPARLALVMTAGVVLAAADAVKYATALFTPVVIVAVGMAAWRRSGRGPGLAVALELLGSWLAVIVTAIVVAGHEYWLGFTASTLDRPQAAVPVRTVLQHSYIWTSLILVLAVLGSVLAVRGEARGRLLLIVLTAAAVLAPVMQARLHTTVSLQKHVVFGAWFAAIAAGYAMARLSRVDPGRGWAAVMALPIAASTLFGSIGQATALYQVWPNSAAAVSLLRFAVDAHPGNYLAEDYDAEAYYLRTEVPWQRWSNTFYFRYRGAPPGPPSYGAAIAGHYFSLVILDFADTPAADRQITSDMRRAGRYYVLARAGQYTIWALEAPTSAGSPRGTDARP
jgi:Dolichyl-phosphate-mannose-protein mannosyltransferase